MSCGCENKFLQGTLSGQPMRASRGTAKVTSLTDTELAVGTIVESVGIPKYVEDISEYAQYGITEPGWYAIARITAPAGTKVTAATRVEGANGYVATPGQDHVDVAVKFEVAAASRTVIVDWGESTNSFVFKATDLAVRNLDYRVTFYVYDAEPYATWEYGIASGTFQENKTYFTKQGDEYTKALVTIGDPIPAYYVQTLVWQLTSDTTFVEGTDYYTKYGDVYTKATVVAGDPVPANTYYVHAISYVQTTDETFVGGIRYFTKEGNEYVEAVVQIGEKIPAYYVHTKIIFAGMINNITYRFNTIIDCPVEFVLPEIDDECHGCWFEIRLRHAGEYSTTLVAPSSDIKIATEHTQKEKAGMNMINLHYSAVGGAKVWRFMNTHSTFTADVPALVSIEFRTPPADTEYIVGEHLDLTGAVVVATYEDGGKKIVTNNCVFTPARNAVLAETDTELEASLTVGEVTATATVPLTVTQEGA